MPSAVNFVAYDPAKRTCNPADRSLIKRRAGRLGSETKKRRLRRDGGGRDFASSPIRRPLSGASSSASDNESKRVPQVGSAQRWPSQLATTCQTITPSIHTSNPVDTGNWPQMEASDWQGTHVRSSTPKSWNDSQTTSSSETHSNFETAADSNFFNKDFADPFALQSEFAEPNIGGYRSQGTSQPQQQYLARPMGSFDSGFYDTESLDFGFGDIDPPLGPAPDVQTPQPTVQNITSGPIEPLSWTEWPPQSQGVQINEHSPAMNSQSGMNHFDDRAASRNSNKSRGSNRPTPLHVSTPTINAPARSPLVNPPTNPDQISPRTSATPSDSVVDDMLVSLTYSQRFHCSPAHAINLTVAQSEALRSREKQGQLPSGSSAECLRALSESEEARSLWMLNLSRIRPSRIRSSSSEPPTDVYAKAMSKLKSMTHRQQMGVQGILIKLGMAEYHAISFALEVTGLQQDVANRKCLGILSKAESLMDHSLTGLAPAASSVHRHLWPR